MDETTRDEITAFVGARWPDLVRTGVLLGCTSHEAEDLAQTTLLRCLLKWRHVRDADDPAAYTARILINLHRQAGRRRWRGEKPVSRLPDVGTSGGESAVDGSESVRGALATLTAEQREVVVLRIHCQMSESETARVLGIPAGTAKSRYSRALARLAEDPSILELHRGGDR